MTNEKTRRPLAKFLIEEVANDVRYALRGLRRAPGFATIALLTLALAVGVTTAILSIVDVVLLRPLPYANADRLFVVWGTAGEADRIQPSYPDFLDWRERSAQVELAFARGDGFLHRNGELTETVAGAMVSEGWFDVLGVRPALGRGFAPAEEQPGGDPVVMLSHALWTSRFAQDRNVIGRSITLGGTRYTVVGVMPPGVAYPEWAQLWLPLAVAGARDATLRERANRVDNRAIGRVSAGVGIAGANAQLDAIARALQAEHPQTNRGLGVRLAGMREEVVGEVRAQLLVLLTAAALVLVIACANLANLLLARSAGRVREMAVRRALGALGGRIARQLLTESVVLAGVGGVAGVLLARLLLDRLVRIGAAQLPVFGIDLAYLRAVGLDARVLGLAAGLTVLTGLLFGSAPAVLAARESPAAWLRGGPRSVGGRRGGLQALLVVAQLALAVTLLGGAGLLLRSHGALNRVDPGFAPDSLVVLRVQPPPSYASPGARASLYDRLVERVEAVPGVAAASLINHMPLTGGLLFARVQVPGSPPAEQPLAAAYRTVAEDFFDVAGVPVVRGRGFGAEDQSPGSGAFIVNEALAELLWPGEDALGRSLTVLNPTQGSDRFGDETTGSVIGVVGTTRTRLAEEGLPAVYVPHRWDPWATMVLVVRAERDASSIVAAVRRAVLEVEDDLPVAEVAPMRERIRASLVRQEFNAALMAGFALLALVLGVVGVYGVLSHLVALRRREIGIRMAIGATARDVRRLVVREAARLAALGTVLGLAGAWALARVMRGLLFGVATTDPVTFVLLPIVLGAAALLACLVPAERAVRVQPFMALRETDY